MFTVVLCFVVPRWTVLYKTESVAVDGCIFRLPVIVFMLNAFVCKISGRKFV